VDSLHSRIRVSGFQRVALGLGVLLLLFGLFSVTDAGAHSGKESLGDQVQATENRKDPVQEKVGYDQRLGEQLPLDLTFRDASGRSVALNALVGQKPIILTFLYYRCTMLCPLILDALTRSLREVSFTAGQEFDVVVVSIDPRETPALAETRKAQYVARYERPGADAGFHFLTGDADAIRRLTRAAGFRYAYDAKTDEYAHAAGAIVVTPQGKIARYFYGIEFPPRDLRLGLVEAAGNAISSPVDQLLLLCYRYDHVSGKYSLAVKNLLRVAGATTVLLLGTFVVVMVRRERRTPRLLGGPGKTRVHVGE